MRPRCRKGIFERSQGQEEYWCTYLSRCFLVLAKCVGTNGSPSLLHPKDLKMPPGYLGIQFRYMSWIWLAQNRVKRPLLTRVTSLARFFDNLTEITYVKERIVEFFSLKLSTLLCDVCSWFNVHCYYTVEKKFCDLTTRNWQFLINKHETALPKSLFCDLEADIWAAKLLYE